MLVTGGRHCSSRVSRNSTFWVHRDFNKKKMESIKNTIWYIFIRFWNRTFPVCVKLLISLSSFQTPNPTTRSVLFHSLSVSTTARHRRLPDIAFWRQWTPVQPSRAYSLGSRALFPPAFRSPCRRWNTYTDFGPGGNCRVIKVPFMASTPVRYGTVRHGTEHCWL